MLYCYYYINFMQFIRKKDLKPFYVLKVRY